MKPGTVVYWIELRDAAGAPPRVVSGSVAVAGDMLDSVLDFWHDAGHRLLPIVGHGQTPPQYRSTRFLYTTRADAEEALALVVIAELR